MVSILSNLFDEQIVDEIMKIPLGRFGGNERLIWSGTFT